MRVNYDQNKQQQYSFHNQNNNPNSFVVSEKPILSPQKETVRIYSQAPLTNNGINLNHPYKNDYYSNYKNNGNKLFHLQFNSQNTKTEIKPTHEPKTEEIFNKIDNILEIYDKKEVNILIDYIVSRIKERSHSNITKFKNVLMLLEESVNKIQNNTQNMYSIIEKRTNYNYKDDLINQNNSNTYLENKINNEKFNVSDNEEKIDINKEENEDLLPQMSEEISDKKYNEYILKRQNFILEIQETKYNGTIFSSEEERANKIFKRLVKNLKGQLKDDFYKEFTMKHKDLIEKTNIYKILKKMPKGANLHLHVDTAFDPDWYLKFAYHPNAYIKLENGRIYYRKENPGSEYIRIIDQRNKAQDTLKFDEEFKKTLLITSDDIKHSKNIWAIFQEKLWQVDGLLLYKDYFKQYLIHMAKQYDIEGIDHIEAKIVMGYIVDENGKPIETKEELQLYRDAIKEINKDLPDFTIKLVVQGLKGWSLERIDDCLKKLTQLMQTEGDLILGFDLVQEEDKYKSIADMVEILLKKEDYEKEYGVKLEFVLHGGESLNITNQNLFDLILLKSKRIGHALNLTKHSYLMDVVKKAQIGIEICPCSNQILDYVYDLRLHPGTTYLNKGLKVIICPDDPGYFNSNYITFDFFMAAVAMEFDIKDLKMCCLNSLECSLLSKEEKNKKIESWRKRWDSFIDNFLKEYW